MILCGLVVMGLGAPMVSIPVLPEVLDSLEQRKDLNYDQDQVNNRVTSYFVCATGIGEAVGPITSSSLEHLVGFSHAYEIFGLTLITFTVIYFVFCGGFEICRAADTIDLNQSNSSVSVRSMRGSKIGVIRYMTCSFGQNLYERNTKHTLFSGTGFDNEESELPDLRKEKTLQLDKNSDFFN